MRHRHLVFLLIVLSIVGGALFAAQGEEKVLVVCQAGDVAVLDNQQSTGTAKNTIIQIYDWQFFRFGTTTLENGVEVSTREIFPGIVRDWKTVVHDDGTCTHTFYLREDGVFHSGNPITAADLKYAMMRRAALGRDYIHTFFGGMYGYKEGLDQHIRVIDNYTLEIDAKVVMPYFLDVWQQRTYFDSVLLQANATADDPWALKFAAKNDAGSGPYVLDRWVPGVELQLSRFDGYWGEAPYFDRIIWSIVPDLASRILLLKSGDVDIAFNIPMKEVLSLRDEPGIRVVSGPSANQLGIQMNAHVPPYDNADLRWALTYAFPYDEIVPSIYAGNAQPNFGPVPAGFIGALTERRYNTDLVKAREHLVSAGYGDGITLTLNYQVGYPEHEQIGILFKENLKQIGVEIELRQLPTGQFQTGTKQQSIGLLIAEALGWFQTAEYYYTLNYLSSSSANYNGYGNPAVDALITPALTVKDDADRAAINAQIQELILADATWIYICQPNFTLAMRDNIDGYIIQNTELHHLWLLSRAGGG
jgi:peptide/nickel transport system substrate-binding protein